MKFYKFTIQLESLANQSVSLENLFACISRDRRWVGDMADTVQLNLRRTLHNLM